MKEPICHILINGAEVGHFLLCGEAGLTVRTLLEPIRSDNEWGGLVGYERLGYAFILSGVVITDMSKAVKAKTTGKTIRFEVRYSNAAKWYVKRFGSGWCSGISLPKGKVTEVESNSITAETKRLGFLQSNPKGRPPKMPTEAKLWK